MEDKYYYVDGKTPMTKDEFLKFYSGVYLWQNSVFVEDCVLKILRKEKSQIDVEDLIVILAWKMGKINHKQSSHENKLVFHEGWSVQEKKAKFYEHTLDIDLIFDKFKSITDDSVESYLKEFSAGDTYIGPVYALTLRYFATKGAEPIYDYFASEALWYIFGIEPKLKEPTFGALEGGSKHSVKNRIYK